MKGLTVLPVTIAAKLHETEKGSCGLTPEEREQVDREVTATPLSTLVYSWCHEMSDKDRETFVWMLNLSCPWQMAGFTLRACMAEAAQRDALAQVREELAQDLNRAQVAKTEAETMRAEAATLLSLAREVGANLTMRAEVDDLRTQLREANAKLNAIRSAFAD